MFNHCGGGGSSDGGESSLGEAKSTTNTIVNRSCVPNIGHISGGERIKCKVSNYEVFLDSQVSIGGEICKNLVLEGTDLFYCDVPRSPFGKGKTNIVVTSADGLKTSLDDAFFYNDCYKSDPLIKKEVSMRFGQTLNLDTFCGADPFSYTMVSGKGSLSDGIFKAPDEVGETEIKQTDSMGNSFYTVISITGEAVSFEEDAMAVYPGGSYSLNLKGGEEPFRYSLVDTTTGRIPRCSSRNSYGYSYGDYGFYHNCISYREGRIVFSKEAVVGMTIKLTVSDKNNDISSTLLTISKMEVKPSSSYLMLNSEVLLSTEGGEAPFEYTLDSDASGVISGDLLTPKKLGNITVNVKDSNGGLSRKVFNVLDEIKIGGTTGEVRDVILGEGFSFSMSGGRPPYTYEVIPENGGSLDGQVFTGEAPGEVVIAGEDSLGNKGSFKINIIPKLSSDLVLKPLSIEQPVSLGVKGGGPPYVYSVTPANLGRFDKGSFIAEQSGAGKISVRDSLGQLIDISISVVEQLELDIEKSIIRAGESLVYTFSGGLSPYTICYKRKNASKAGVCLKDQTEGGEFVLNTPGAYELSITDSLGVVVFQDTEVITNLVARFTSVVKNNEVYRISMRNVQGNLTYKILEGESSLNVISVENCSTCKYVEFTPLHLGDHKIELMDSTGDLKQISFSSVDVAPLGLYIEYFDHSFELGNGFQFLSFGGAGDRLFSMDSCIISSTKVSVPDCIKLNPDGRIFHNFPDKSTQLTVSIIVQDESGNQRKIKFFLVGHNHDENLVGFLLVGYE